VTTDVKVRCFWLQDAPWGYDLRVYVQQVSGLSVVGHPYIMVLMHLGGHDVQYRWAV
jgi:hypothetical protein